MPEDETLKFIFEDEYGAIYLDKGKRPSVLALGPNRGLTFEYAGINFCLPEEAFRGFCINAEENPPVLYLHFKSYDCKPGETTHVKLGAISIDNLVEARGWIEKANSKYEK